MNELYFAAPLFSDAERAYNERIVSLIERLCPVFLPQRDGRLVSELVARGVTVEAAFQEIRRADLTAIRGCSMLVAVLDGGNVDDGVAFELGYGFALGKPCIGLQTDFRRSIFGRNNPIVEASLKRVVTNEAALVQAIKEELTSEHDSNAGAPPTRGNSITTTDHPST